MVGVHDVGRGVVLIDADDVRGVRPACNQNFVDVPEQALRLAVPPAVNIFVALLKGATLLSVIAVADMFYVAQLASANEFKPFELYTAAAVIMVAAFLAFARTPAAAELHDAIDARLPPDAWRLHQD